MSNIENKMRMASWPKTNLLAEIDAIVCQWTIDTGVGLTEKQLNELVDRIAAYLGAPIPANGALS